MSNFHLHPWQETVSDRSWALQLAKPVLQFDALVQHLGQLENTEMQEWKQEQKQEGMPKT